MGVLQLLRVLAGVPSPFPESIPLLGCLNELSTAVAIVPSAHVTLVEVGERRGIVIVSLHCLLADKYSLIWMLGVNLLKISQFMLSLLQFVLQLLGQSFLRIW